MEIYEYQIVMARIKEIEQERLHYLDYIYDKIDYMIDVQKENVWERILQLQEEKKKLIEYENRKAQGFSWTLVNCYVS